MLTNCTEISTALTRVCHFSRPY